jgi:hypothetical protein
VSGKAQLSWVRAPVAGRTAASIQESVSGWLTLAQELLGIYLNDHLAGATSGTELARRVASSSQEVADGELLRRLADDIGSDRQDPLSSLEELELLRLGVEGKAAGWRTLREMARSDRRLDPARLDELIARARDQAGLLEELRVQAAASLVGTGS